MTTSVAHRPIAFTDIAHSAGIDFQHVNGSRGRKLMPETVGSGLALFDYDNDGKLDLLIMNSTTWPGDPNPIKTTPKLYHNLGAGKFEDVTTKLGLGITLYGMGVAVGDYDNDGFEDIYLTAVGANFLFHNEAGKGFRDVTAQSGTVGVPLPGTKLEHKWSSSSAWLDYDNDGYLDLFVCQYVKWSPEIDPYCGKNGIRGYCPPGNFEGARCTLFHNEGTGQFRDVSKGLGLLDIALGKSFGIAVADYNRDGWLDIAVANDTWANFLLMNDAGKHFTDKGVESGIAFSMSGKAKAGMGIDVADFRNNGKLGLVIGNFAEEGLSLFEPMEGMETMFEEKGQSRGISAASLSNVTFATFFFDYNLDGWQDIFATNGHVDDIVSTYKSNLTFKQEPLLFENKQGENFSDVTKQSGINYKLVGRGAAYGDIDNDGDLDVGIVDNNGKFLLLRNDGGNQNNWLRLKLIGTKSNRDGIGALVTVSTGKQKQRRYVRSGGSFLSESERVLTFGLGSATTIDSVEIRWPSGKLDTLNQLGINTMKTIVEGKGVE
ncbi:CRTAC1 family protein [Armatimonas sp.]|uniref:CRTAC1 family protein n=1 Tax=Armatimonas sp. TaxID=1872638 RepID=UPI0037508099